MLVDQNNVFMTQRVHHRMALFKVEVNQSGLRVRHGSSHIDVPHDLAGDSIAAQIWDDAVTVCATSTEHDRWFSDLLSINCRLVTFPEANPRAVDSKYGRAGDHVSLADGYPVLVIGQASLDDLNTRLADPLPMNRFRPNVVVTGSSPYDEDSWRDFSIGSNRFFGAKNCGRCALPTVNQETGISGKEPLATLSKYRTVDGKVYFGRNVIPVDHDEIKIGDEVIIHSRA